MSTKKTLTQDAKRARMQSWLRSQRFDDINVDVLIEKYGVDYAHSLIQDAMMEPYTMCNKIGVPAKNSKAMINSLIEGEYTPEQLATLLNVTPEEVRSNLQQNDAEPFEPTPTPEPQIETQERQEQFETQVDIRDVLSSEQVNYMRSWLPRVGVDAENIETLVTMYGEHSYRLVQGAIERNGGMCSRMGVPYKGNKELIEGLIAGNYTPEQLSRFLGVSAESIRQAGTLTPPESQELAPEGPDNRQRSGRFPEVEIPEDVAARMELSAEQAAQERLDALKNGETGELSFETLAAQGVSVETISQYMTPESLSSIHAGPNGKKIAAQSIRSDSSRDGSGYCLAGVQDTIRVALGQRYPQNIQRIPGSSSNSACFCHEAFDQLGYIVFQFDNNTQDGNPCLKELSEGAIVNFEGGRNTKHGHVCIVGSDGYYHSDTTQNPSTIASGRRRGGQPYGEHFYVSYTPDATLSDEFLLNMFKEQELARMREQYTPTIEGGNVTIPFNTEVKRSPLNLPGNEM